MGASYSSSAFAQGGTPVTIRRFSLALLTAGAFVCLLAANAAAQSDKIKHVLLISVDGMHAVDFTNCANGISTVNHGAPYCPALAALAKTGINYVAASTSKPSDSFPGLTAIVTGGRPAPTGAHYHVAYSRNYDAPLNTTGNGVAGGSCTPNTKPTGTTPAYGAGTA